MYNQDNENPSNTITVDGVTFKTSGNIVFSDDEESPYYLAQSSLLEQFDGYLENGMQQFLKKIMT
ncbi:hypothetical protein ACFL37_00380 [Candidatus Margulisiibacteriota bacterium]